MRGNMRAERVRRGLTATDVAKVVGVHPNALLRWEKGDSEPMGENLVALAWFYECTPEYLLEQTDDPHGKAVAV